MSLDDKPEFVLKAAERGESDRIVLGEAGDVFDKHIVTADAKVDTVGVFDVNLVIGLRNLIRMVNAVGIDARKVGFKAKIAENGVMHENIGYAPPTLVDDGQIFDAKIRNVKEKQRGVDRNVRQAVFFAVFFGKPVVGAAVKNRVSDAAQRDVFLFAGRRARDFFCNVFVGEHVAECAVGKAQMGIVENNFDVTWQKNGAVDAPDICTGAVVVTRNTHTVCAALFGFGYGVLNLFGVGCTACFFGLNARIHRNHSFFASEFRLFVYCNNAASESQVVCKRKIFVY